MILGATKSQIRLVTKAVRADFRHRYGDGEALRQNLFEQQNGLCILCNKPMQGPDSIFTHIEHMIPVREYADYYVAGISLERVLECANDKEKNLRLSHTSCGVEKHSASLEEQIPDHFFDDVENRTLTSEEIQRQKEARREQGRQTGGISGRKNVESGQIYRIRTPESCAKGGRVAGRMAAESGRIQVLGRKHGPELGRKYGPIHGRINAESGRLQALGRIQGPKNVESGLLARFRTYDNCAKGGRIAGCKNVETGHMERMHALPQSMKAYRESGRLYGRKNAEEGKLHHFSGAECAQGGRRSHELHPELAAQNASIVHAVKDENGKSVAAVKAGRIGGRIGGRLGNREAKRRQGLINGSLPANIERLRLMNHNRWHIPQGIVKQGCKFCASLLAEEKVV